VVAAVGGVVVAVGLCTISMIKPGRQAIRSGMYLGMQRTTSVSNQIRPSSFKTAQERKEGKHSLAVAWITHERHSHGASFKASNLGIEGVQHVLQEHKAFFARYVRVDQLKVLDDGAHPEALHACRTRCILGHAEGKGMRGRGSG